MTHCDEFRDLKMYLDSFETRMTPLDKFSDLKIYFENLGIDDTLK